MNYKSILVVTYGRSGSTLLQGLLNSIDDTIIRGENYDFCYGLYKSWQAINSAVDHYGNHTPARSPNNPWYGAANFDQHAFIAQAKSIVRTQLLPADASADTVYEFKEIRHMNHLDDLEGYLQFLNRIFPQPAIIFNTRNISDVISSQWWQSKADVSTPLIEKATKLFADYCLNHSNAYLVKYEEIISDLDHIKQLFSFLGAPFSEQETLKVLNTVHSYGAKQSTLAQSRHISQETLSRQQATQTTPTIKGSLVLETKLAEKRLKEGVIIILVIRDEALRLPWILEYYTQLNCAGFIVIDDGSTDGSLEIVRARNDTIIYHVNNLKYDQSSHFGTDWINAILPIHAKNRWVIKVDADELLCWPNSLNEGLNGLTKKAEQRGITSFFTPMIDLYAEQSISASARYQSGQPFQKSCNLADPVETYVAKWQSNGYLRIFGGPRMRHNPDEGLGPLMTKQALFFYSDGPLKFANPHALTDPRPSPLVAPLLHFKFLSDFEQKCDKAIIENKHWNNASEYR